MAQLTVRNLPPELVRALKVRAARHGRSAEAEHRLILAEALRGEWPDFWTKAAESRRRMPRQKSDSAKLLRQLRDGR